MVVAHEHRRGSRGRQGAQRLEIFAIPAIVDILDADGKSQIDAVVDIAADVEVVVANVSRVSPVEVILCGINVVHLAILVGQQVAIQFVHLTLAPVGVKVTPHALDGGLAVLRRAVDGPGGCREHIVEITALVEVEAKVQEVLQSRALGEHDTHLVERGVDGLSVVERRAAALYDHSERE